MSRQDWWRKKTDQYHLRRAHNARHKRECRKRKREAREAGPQQQQPPAAAAPPVIPPASPPPDEPEMPVLIRGPGGNEDTSQLQYAAIRVGLNKCCTWGRPVVDEIRRRVKHTNTRIDYMVVAEQVHLHAALEGLLPDLPELFNRTYHMNMMMYDGNNNHNWRPGVVQLYQQYPFLRVPVHDAPRAIGDTNTFEEAASQRVTAIENHLRVNALPFIRRLVYSNAEAWGDKWVEQGNRRRRKKVVSKGTQLCKWVVAKILGVAPPPGETLPAEGTRQRTEAEAMVVEVRQNILGLPAAPEGQEPASPQDQLDEAWVQNNKAREGHEQRMWRLVRLFAYIARHLHRLGAKQITVLPMGQVAHMRFILVDTRVLHGVMRNARVSVVGLFFCVACTRTLRLGNNSKHYTKQCLRVRHLT